MRLETERLILRPPETADAGTIAQGLSDWEVVKMLATAPYPYTQADALQWLESLSARPGAGQKHCFMLTLKQDGAGIGVASLETRAARGGAHDEAIYDGATYDEDWRIGFWLARAHWGKGLMTEAAGALVRFGFGTLGLPRIRSGCFADNPASLRVHDKLGFRRAGESAMVSRARGRAAPHIDLVLDREDWKPA